MTKATVHMARLTAAEMREAIVRNPVILLPLGSFEDQGPHMPMGDYLLADAVAERIAQEATQAGHETYVAPVLPFGGADFFGYMPGGIALSQTTLQAVLSDMLESLLRHGLTRLVILNGHGGNCTMIHDVTHSIMRKSGVIIPSFYLWRVAATIMPHIMGKEKAALSGGHGANPLTSIGMHLLPECIKPERLITPDSEKTAWGLKVVDFGTVDLNGVPVSIPLEGDSTATHGVGKGNPHLCSAEDGERLTAKLVEYGVQLVEHVIKKAS
ncbi:creatininase family protein [Acetobacter senegalensis]|uniref:creatininase family protein n=1 Tax=Acetobacter senegalensis TaxID=446692 RepID=UPI0020A21A7A|nr:creatininase family protein [Acetobacter senegalensis]MCP1196738.1 creatininase family protein [Acetobacter senegalensis]